jgi:Phage P22-like portal protein
MADTAYVATPQVDLYGSRSPEAQQAMLAKMRACFKRAQDYEDLNRRDQERWLQFRAGNQWEGAEEQRREAAGRPCLTINTLPQSEHQITNEVLLNMPEVTILPVGDGADQESAKVRKGLIRHCNQRSHAESVRQLALESAVRIGAGYYRMVLEYDDWQSFDQEPRLAGLRNQFACYLDPSGCSPVGRDAAWGFIFEHQDREAFRQEWGIDAGTMNAWTGVGDSWVFQHHVRVAEYFYKEYQRFTLAQMQDGQTILLEPILLQPLMTLQQEGYEGSAFQNFVAFLLTPRPRYAELLPWIQQQAPTASAWLDGFPGDFVREYQMMVMDLVASLQRVRPTQQCTVRWLKTNGQVILEESIWPGEHIPLIRVVGEEFDLDNKVVRQGIIANAMDPMRLKNYFVTMMCEHVALAPVPGWILDPRQIQGQEYYWQTANRLPHAYLPYNANVSGPGGTPLGPPQRSAYEPPIQGIGFTLQMIEGYEQQTLGIYQGNVGAPSRERSGTAIAEKDRQSDTGTYHYKAHLAQAMQYEGELYMEVLPRTLQPGKIQRILGDDGAASMVRIAGSPQQQQQMQQQMQQDPDMQRAMLSIYDASTGKYDVVVSVGPSYATKREEAQAQMIEMQRAQGAVLAPATSFIIRQMDWEKADELADIVAQVPGQITPEQSQNKDMQMAFLKQQLTQMQQQLQALDAFGQQQQQLNAQLMQDNQRLKDGYDLEALKVQDQQEDTHLEQQKAQQEALFEQQKLDLEARKLALEEQKARWEHEDRMLAQYARAQQSGSNGASDA